MYNKFVTVDTIVTMVRMKLRSFVIEPFVQKVNFGVIMEHAFQNQKNVTESVTVPMVPMKFSVVERDIVVGEF